MTSSSQPKHNDKILLMAISAWIYDWLHESRVLKKSDYRVDEDETQKSI